MDRRVADAIRRGRVVCDANDQDLFDVDYHELAPRQIEEVRAILQVPEKGRGAREAGSKALSDREGMSETQQRYVDERAAHEAGHQ